MNTEAELNKAYYMWLAELNRLQRPTKDLEDAGLTLESLIDFLRGTTKT